MRLNTLRGIWNGCAFLKVDLSKLAPTLQLQWRSEVKCKQTSSLLNEMVIVIW